jgi:uncharacterized protein (DUF885 family)
MSGYIYHLAEEIVLTNSNIFLKLYFNTILKMSVIFRILFLILYLSPVILTGQSNQPVRIMIEQYSADKQMFYAKYNLHRGHDYLHRMNALMEDWMDKVKEVNYKTLNAEDKLDLLLLRRQIGLDKNQYMQLEKDLPLVHRYLPFEEVIADFERLRRSGHRARPAEWAVRFADLETAIPATVNRLESAIADTSIRPSLNDLAALQAASRELLQAFKYSRSFYIGYDTLFTRACKPGCDSVISSLSILSDSLDNWRSSKVYAMDASGINGTPIGYAAFAAALHDQMIPYSPDQLIDWAEEQMAWCTAEAKKAAAEMGFGDDWKAALDKTKQDYVPMGFQPTLVVNLADEAIDFIEQKKLITIPELAKEGWYMRMLTPKEQKYAPFFLGGDQILIAYPHEDMSEEERLMCMRGNNRHFTRAVVFHELIPGHNLQYFYGERYHPYRQMFGTPFWTEGWAVYWELTMSQNGFARTPQERLGMLFWRMHRCARIIFSTRYHTGQWTPQQCIDFLVDHVGHERENAIAEVRRSFSGGYGPLYQIGYLTGAMQFIALHHEFVDSGRMSNIAFHKKILEAGPMPVALVREMLSGMENDKETLTPWYFLE